MIDFTDSINQLVKMEHYLTQADIDPSRRSCAILLHALLTEIEMGFNGDFFDEGYVREKCLTLIESVKGMKEENERISVS